MTSTLSASKLALLKKLATREAARRHIDQESRRDATPINAGPSSVTLEDVEAIEQENQQLEQMLKEEKAQNDVEWDKVRERLATLKENPSTNTDGRSLKQRELALLEHDIKSLAENLPRLDPPLNEYALSLVTRGILASSIEQHEASLHSKRNELARERYLLQQDAQTWEQLKDVKTGLEARKVRLLRKQAEGQDQRSAVAALRKRVDTVEASIEHLLSSVIEISNSLYDDRDSDKREQLKHLIDRLVNAAWDTPDNPWVNVSQQYPPSIVTFLVRANIALEHPKDARNLRLVDFHR